MKKINKKSIALGLNYGTACHQLRKKILFHFAGKLGMLNCFRCGAEIQDIKEFSIEHKTEWNSNPDLFWDIENIAFSHLKCNYEHGIGLPRLKVWEHGDYGYRIKKCRCAVCKTAHDKYR